MAAHGHLWALRQLSTSQLLFLQPSLCPRARVGSSFFYAGSCLWRLVLVWAPTGNGQVRQGPGVCGGSSLCAGCWFSLHLLDSPPVCGQGF